MAASEDRWSVDKRIPAWAVFVFVIGVLGQAAWATSQIGAAGQRLSAVEARQSRIDQIPERLARIEALLEELRSSRGVTGPSARCADGALSFSQSRQGTCANHGGVAEWMQ